VREGVSCCIVALVSDEARSSDCAWAAWGLSLAPICRCHVRAAFTCLSLVVRM
jgi:hypothetical protein